MLRARAVADPMPELASHLNRARDCFVDWGVVCCYGHPSESEMVSDSVLRYPFGLARRMIRRTLAILDLPFEAAPFRQSTSAPSFAPLSAASATSQPFLPPSLLLLRILPSVSRWLLRLATGVRDGVQAEIDADADVAVERIHQVHASGESRWGVVGFVDWFRWDSRREQLCTSCLCSKLLPEEKRTKQHWVSHSF